MNLNLKKKIKNVNKINFGKLIEFRYKHKNPSGLESGVWM